MSRSVHIKVHIPTHADMGMCLLVFRTIRIGFPTSPIYAHVDSCDERQWKQVIAALDECSAKLFTRSTPQTHCLRHDDWIESLLVGLEQPIVICDTDMVFHESVEDWAFDHPLAGAFEPTHWNPVTNAIHWARLHTSLLFVNPFYIRHTVKACLFNDVPHVDTLPKPDLLVKQTWIPNTYNHIDGPSKMVFADTGCRLYRLIGGQAFTDAQRDAYTHMHCGTWSDVVAPHFKDLKSAHAQAVQDPQSVRGLWRKYEQFYAANAA